MATKKSARKTKSGTRGKKLGRAKQMKEVKPLAMDAYMSFIPYNSAPVKD